jgi:hypothetical protein
MTIIDDFLPKEIFKKLQDYCRTEDFEIVEQGGKQFSVLEVPDFVEPYFELKGHKIVLTFIRNAYRDFDNKERIHCDGIINNQEINKAAVFYINDRGEVPENGTKFYSHHKHGEYLQNMSNEEFDRLILEDSDDVLKWNETHYVHAEPNRLLRYNARFFHGKYPAMIEKGVRKVLVIFYAKE